MPPQPNTAAVLLSRKNIEEGYIGERIEMSPMTATKVEEDKKQSMKHLLSAAVALLPGMAGKYFIPDWL